MSWLPLNQVNMWVFISRLHILVLVYSFRFGFQNDFTKLSAPNFTSVLLITMGGISSAGSYQCTFCTTLYQKWVGYVMRTQLLRVSSVSIFSSLCFSLAHIFIPLIQFGIFEENIPKVFTFRKLRIFISSMVQQCRLEKSTFWLFW